VVGVYRCHLLGCRGRDGRLGRIGGSDVLGASLLAFAFLATALAAAYLTLRFTKIE